VVVWRGWCVVVLACRVCRLLQAREAYDAALASATTLGLELAHPLRLRVHVNYSVLLFESACDTEAAVEMARKGHDPALSSLAVLTPSDRPLAEHLLDVLAANVVRSSGCCVHRHGVAC
jgi:hypothetical protein